jgi:hypothetical protein
MQRGRLATTFLLVAHAVVRVVPTFPIRNAYAIDFFLFLERSHGNLVGICVAPGDTLSLVGEASQFGCLWRSWTAGYHLVW